jgi:hypothetical protein
VSWALRSKVPAGEFGAWIQSYSELVGVSVRTLHEWRVQATEQVGIIDPYKSKREPKAAGESGRLAESRQSPKVIPAASTEAPAKQSVGSGPGIPQTRPGVAAPADPSSGGADVQRPAAPTGEAPTSSPSAPPDPTVQTPGFAVPLDEWVDPEEIIERDFGGTMLRGPRKYIDECKLIPLPERPPSDRQLAARVYAHMREVDPTDAGPVTTPEEATFLRQWAQRTLDAWKAVYAPPAPTEKPQRRQGTITRPADRAPKPPVKVNGAPIAGNLTRRTVEPMFKK